MIAWAKDKWRRFKACLRLDLDEVCELSKDMGLLDYHDYQDDILGKPCHFCVLTCKRCGKNFYM